MALYPSQEWCDFWKNTLNEDTAVEQAGQNWGVDFNGNLVFELQPGDGLEEKTYVYLQAKAGKCTGAEIIADPAQADYGFLVEGSYGVFKPVVKGELDFIEAVVKGQLKLKGDMSKIMRNAKFIRAVANSISSFENEYLGE